MGPTKIQVIIILLVPQRQKHVCSFISYAGYYRRFEHIFSKISCRLFLLMTKKLEFKWSNSFQKEWETLKQKVSTPPILRGPNWSLTFIISTYSSNTTIGGYLGQQEGQKPYVIYFISKDMTSTELNYTVMEKE